MDVKKYEVMLNVVDKGSFFKAREDLGYTQSGISHMMNSLEEEIGVSLLLRSNKGIRLTPEGERVMPLIRELVQLNEQLQEEFSAMRGAETGKLRIGSYPTLAYVWLPKILRMMKDEHPGIEVDVVEENSIYQLDQWLTEGSLDLCMVSYQPAFKHQWIPLQYDPYMAVLPAGHPLARQQAVPSKELMGDSFLMFRSLSRLDPDMERYFTAADTPIRSSFTTNSDYTVLRMVEQNLGTCILPKLILDAVVRAEGLQVEVRPLMPEGGRELGVAIRADRRISPAMRSFIECAKKLTEQEGKA